MSCRECATDVAHCHEVLLVHADGSYECTGEGSCAGRVEVHTWVASCTEVGPDCCTEELPLAA